MASAHRYTWESAGRPRSAWRAKWTDVQGTARSKRGFARRTDAQRYAEDREAEARHGLTLGQEQMTGGTTLRAWSTRWLGQINVRDSSRASYEAALARVLPTLGDRPLTALRRSEVRQWRSELGRKYAATTADQTTAILGMVLRAAVEDGLITASPLPRKTGGKSAGRVVDPNELLTLEQVAAWSAAMPECGRAMPLVAAMTGLRQGELLGLRLGSVDFLRRQVRVVEQLVTPRGAGGPAWGPPKTAAGVRALPLPAPAAAALAVHLERFPPIDGEPVFRGSRGQRWRRGTFGDVWREARDRAGLPGWAHWHALRDVYASTLIRQGVDVRSVMTYLGHTSSEETLRTYSRLWPDAEDVARTAVENAWDAEGPEQGHEHG